MKTVKLKTFENEKKKKNLLTLIVIGQKIHTPLIL